MNDKPPPGARTNAHGARWLHMVLAIGITVAIANFQYGWTFFVPDLEHRFAWQRSSLQMAFVLFTIGETGATLAAGWLVGLLGPRRVIVSAAALAALGWVLSALSTSPHGLLAGQAMAGIGAGSAFTAAAESALRGFDGRARKLAASCLALALGIGAAILVVPTLAMIAAYGSQGAMLWLGLAQGASVAGLALFLADPRLLHDPSLDAASTGPDPSSAPPQRRHYTPVEVLSHRVFWLLFALCFVASAGGLTLIASLASMAADLAVAQRPLDAAEFTISGLAAAAISLRLWTGLARPLHTLVADRVSPEFALLAVFTAQAAGFALLGSAAQSPIVFALASGLVAMGWGGTFAVFPAVASMTFGARYAATNAALLYFAKGLAALAVPLAAALHATAGSWTPVFTTLVGACLAAIAATLWLLRAWRTEVMRRGQLLPSRAFA